MRLKALDVSSYTGPISQALWQLARNGGWGMAIVQAWGGRPAGMGPNPLAWGQLLNAREAGLRTAAYIWLPPDDTTETQALVQSAKDAVDGEWQHLDFVAIDIEDPQQRRLHPSDPVARLRDCLSHIGDKPLVIYTSLGMWPALMGETAAFSHLPLWDASWGTGEDLDAHFTPYGGWTRRAAKQYQATTPVHGFNADLNVVDLSRIAPAESVAPTAVEVPWGAVAAIEAAQLALSQQWRELRQYLDRHGLGA